MIPESLRAKIHKAYDQCTPEEEALIVAEGNLNDLGDLVSLNMGKNKAANKRFRELRKAAGLDS